MALAILIMAAGKGTRMKSDLPKVLHRANGKPIVEYVLDTASILAPDKTIIIVGHEAEKVIEAIRAYPVTPVLQEPQLGTGNAVMQAEAPLDSFEGEVLILSGDAPLVRAVTLEKLVAFHRDQKAAATVLNKTRRPVGIWTDHPQTRQRRSCKNCRAQGCCSRRTPGQRNQFRSLRL